MSGFSRNIGARATELSPKALLGRRPQNVSIAIAKAHWCVSFMFALAGVARFMIPRAHAGSCASTGASSARTHADAFARAQALVDVKGVGKGLIVGGTFENGISAVRIVSDEE